MTTAADQPSVDEGQQLCLFELVKCSTINPPFQPKLSAADWLLNPNNSINDTSIVKEGTV